MKTNSIDMCFPFNPPNAQNQNTSQARFDFRNAGRTEAMPFPTSVMFLLLNGISTGLV